LGVLNGHVVNKQKVVTEVRAVVMMARARLANCVELRDARLFVVLFVFQM
jgi:hypothetical protein